MKKIFSFFKRKKLDLEVGTRFVERGELFEVEKAPDVSGFVLPCRGCDFQDYECGLLACKSEERKDGQNVIFKDVTGKLIKTEELKIRL